MSTNDMASLVVNTRTVANTPLPIYPPPPSCTLFPCLFLHKVIFIFFTFLSNCAIREGRTELGKQEPITGDISTSNWEASRRSRYEPVSLWSASREGGKVHGSDVSPQSTTQIARPWQRHMAGEDASLGIGDW
ncbi:hypothetical protein RRG08_038076 [Elysia crispata]|uniref:Uncharacterized protein n=1 Tax=Elysia crispata TaxID=231223 RepID=A0AAE1DPF5_9GAST|nr:hypothetical protein RRG08_038076 [Elysia crispata]